MYNDHPQGAYFVPCYSYSLKTVSDLLYIYDYVVGHCHHGIARPQVTDRVTASDKEGSCE